MTTTTRERFVILRDPEVREALAGRLTELRRPVKPELGHRQHIVPSGRGWMLCDETECDGDWLRCPLGEPGTVLACKETYLLDDRNNPERVPREVIYAATPEWALDHTGSYVRVTYLDQSPVPPEAAAKSIATNKHWHRKPARTMPSWAVRIRLLVASVGVERNTKGVWDWVAGVKRVEPTP